MGSEKIACIDIGTTNLKFVVKHNNQYEMETYFYKNPEEVIQNIIYEKNLDHIIMTGSGSRFIENSAKYILADELECTANVIRYMNRKEGIVVNMGTGTSFLKYKEGTYQHINGTGIGGGTFIGLGMRMIGTSDAKEIEDIAYQGDLKKVNIVIEDIYQKGLGWLQDDITVSNFGKMNNNKEDVAMGIHSLVTEPIMSMLKAITMNSSGNHIVFSGGVVNNNIIKSLISKYAQIFDIQYEILGNPSYGTCFGAIAWYESVCSK